MLEPVESQVGKSRRLRMARDGEDTAFVMKFVVSKQGFFLIQTGACQPAQCSFPGIFHVPESQV